MRTIGLFSSNSVRRYYFWTVIVSSASYWISVVSVPIAHIPSRWGGEQRRRRGRLQRRRGRRRQTTGTTRRKKKKRETSVRWSLPTGYLEHGRSVPSAPSHRGREHANVLCRWFRTRARPGDTERRANPAKNPVSFFPNQWPTRKD